MNNRSTLSFFVFFILSLNCEDKYTELSNKIAELEELIRSYGRIEVLATFDTEKEMQKQQSQKEEHPVIDVPVMEPKSRTSLDSLHSPAQLIAQKFPQEFPHSFQIALSFFEDPYHFDRTSAKIPNKFLLSGPPGCGKSFLVELLSQQYQLPIIYLKATDLEDRFYGESSRKITEFFKYRDLKGRPVILFIDEIDAIACQRNGSMSQTGRSTLNALLVELQRNSFDRSMFIFVATNNKDVLDAAFLNRFEGQCIEMSPMNYHERLSLIKDLLSNYNMYDEQIITIAANKSAGLSRRALATAIESSYTWFIYKRKTNSGLSYTANDILLFISKAQIDNKSSWRAFAKEFIDKSSKCLTYTNLVLGTTLVAVQLLTNPWIAEKLNNSLQMIPNYPIASIFN